MHRTPFFAPESLKEYNLAGIMGLDADRYRKLSDLHRRMRICRLCVNAGYIDSASPIFAGRPDDRVMVIGQAPGRISLERDVPFAGPGGAKLENWFMRAGFDQGFLRESVYLSSLTKCYPGPSTIGKGDRKPSRSELDLCRPFLLEELEVVNPRVVMLVGDLAIQEMIGHMRLADAVGCRIDRDGRSWLPLPHPSGVSRWLNDVSNQALLDKALTRLADMRGDVDWKRSESC